jgi:hypothetical protein
MLDVQADRVHDRLGAGNAPCNGRGVVDVDRCALRLRAETAEQLVRPFRVPRCDTDRTGAGAQSPDDVVPEEARSTEHDNGKAHG